MSEFRETTKPTSLIKDLADQQKSGRAPLPLGRVVSFRNKREFLKDPFFYIPPWNRTQTESIFIHGSNRSGKTSLASLIALQTLLYENRSWIFIDSKGSYGGWWLPNTEDAYTIQNTFGLEPQGFPTQGPNGERLFRVVAPYYYVRTLTPADIMADAITDSYRIPIHFLDLYKMCELTGIDPKKRYARRYDDVRKRVFAEVPNPTLDDLLAVLQEIIDTTPGAIKRIYEGMKNKIEEEGDVSIQRQGVWSPVGEALREAAMDGLPRFIVVTFQHSDSPLDDRNQACYTAILEEVKEITRLAKRYKWNLKVGIIVDELYYYTRNKVASSWIATHDLLYRWGGGNWILRVFCTQRDVQLDKEFADSVGNVRETTSYTYDVIFHTRKVPSVGYATVLDRLHPIDRNSNRPRLVPNVKICPSLCQIETSDYRVF